MTESAFIFRMSMLERIIIKLMKNPSNTCHTDKQMVNIPIEVVQIACYKAQSMVGSRYGYPG